MAGFVKKSVVLVSRFFLFIEMQVGKMNSRRCISCSMDVCQSAADRDVDTGCLITYPQRVCLRINSPFDVSQYSFAALTVFFMEEDGEFITTKAGCKSVLFSDPFLQGLGDTEEHLIPGIVSIGIIDLLEVVDIPKCQIKRFIMLGRILMALCQSSSKLFVQIILIVKA